MDGGRDKPNAFSEDRNSMFNEMCALGTVHTRETVSQAHLRHITTLGSMAPESRYVDGEQYNNFFNHQVCDRL